MDVDVNFPPKGINEVICLPVWIYVFTQSTLRHLLKTNLTLNKIA